MHAVSIRPATLQELVMVGNAPHANSKPTTPVNARRRKAKAVLDRPAAPGWRTSDEDEIQLRRWRGQTDPLEVTSLEWGEPVFATFRVGSVSGSSYDVEIRSLQAFANSCACIDHRVNGLGTCKHIEGVIARLARRGIRAFRQATEAGSARIELFLDR